MTLTMHIFVAWLNSQQQHLAKKVQTSYNKKMIVTFGKIGEDNEQKDKKAYSDYNSRNHRCYGCDINTSVFSIGRILRGEYI